MFKSYSPSDGLVSCPWPHDVYLVIYAWWYPMAGDWAYLFLGSFRRCYRLKFYDEVLLLDFANYSNMFFIQSSSILYTQERIHRSSDGTHWIYGRFFRRIRILQSVKGKWKSNRPRSIVLFILGEKRVSGTPPLNTILPGQQCPHHGIWDGYCL